MVGLWSDASFDIDTDTKRVTTVNACEMLLEGEKLTRCEVLPKWV